MHCCGSVIQSLYLLPARNLLMLGSLILLLLFSHDGFTHRDYARSGRSVIVIQMRRRKTPIAA